MAICKFLLVITAKSLHSKQKNQEKARVHITKVIKHKGREQEKNKGKKQLQKEAENN